MKNKDLIRHLQSLDPDAEVQVAVIDADGHIVVDDVYTLRVIGDGSIEIRSFVEEDL